MSDADLDLLTDFLRCARKGKMRAASSGERAAYELARQAEGLSSRLMDLDDDKKEGFVKLLLVAASPDARDIVIPMLPS